MVEHIHIMISCPYIGCPRSIGYCFKCDYKKGISNYDLACDYRDAMKIKKESIKKESIKKESNKREKNKI